MIKKISLALVSLMLVSGCAQTTGYRPVYDPYYDRNASNLGIDDQQCQRIASENAGVAKGAATEGLVGALIGGAGGAALGAIVGNPATGAAIGGTIGGLGGAAKGGFQGDDGYKRIYRNCMRQRGHNVLD